MLAIRLPEDTGRTKTFYVREAILDHLNDIEDLYRAGKTTARGPEKRPTPPVEEVGRIPTSEAPSFVSRWQGRFLPAAKSDARYKALEKKYLWFSSSTQTNFHYLLSPPHGSAAAKDFLRDLLLFVDVAQTSTANAAYAMGLPMRDFEDALQVSAAVACGADVIATRNIRDYTGSPVKAELPANLLKRLR
jgi:RHH-type rel operon transcriptional repressor/antitoxin RelB